MFTIHHISLSVTNLEKSISFYSFFGFKKVFEWEADDSSLRIIHLKLGEVFLELFNYSSNNPMPDSAKDLRTDLPVIGIKHFGLKVKSLSGTKALLIKEGFTQSLEITKGRTGIDYLFIKDPDGILLEIIEDKREL